MKHINYPSITKFQQLVELKDYRKPTKKEYVRYVRKLAEHFQCDPASLTEDQVRQCSCSCASTSVTAAAP
jgi:hypothetical protein